MRILPVLFVGALILGSLAGGATFVLRQLNLYPPQEISIAAGKPGSAYHDNATAYREILARDDIELSIIETNGSVENAALLAADDGADMALVQGGIELDKAVRGIASVRLEPLWVFASQPVSDDPSDWDMLRVAAGAEGSGTRVIADRLAKITGADVLHPGRAQAVGGREAANQLLNGDLDIAMYVAPYQATYLQPILEAENINLVELAHDESISLRIPGARLVRLPSGVIDYERPLPQEDMELVALVTRLVSRDELHPALVNRLVHAVIEVHGGYRVIPADRRYPSVLDLGVEADEYAAQLFKDGFNALESVLPYWIVAQLNRVLLVLLPFVLLILPLMRLLPSLYEALLKRRVFGHYARVHEIDAELMAKRQEPLSESVLNAYGEELDAIERKLLNMNLPNVYRKQAYTLLHHLNFVRRRLRLALGGTVPPLGEKDRPSKSSE